MPLPETHPHQGEAPAEGRVQTFLNRLNEFGERHARAIIFASAVLIIVVAVIFVEVLRQRTLFDRLERDLRNAASVEDFESLRDRYAGTPAAPRALAALGHRYYEEGRLRDAMAVYEDFVTRFTDHPLSSTVERSLGNVRESLKFEEEGKEAWLKESLLQVHPLQRADRTDGPSQAYPVKEPNPVAALRVKGKDAVIVIDLFEDEAPKAVANFISRADRKELNGLTFRKVGEDRLQIGVKKEGQPPAPLPPERNYRQGEAGSLITVPLDDGSGHSSFEIQILLEPVTDLRGATVFGQVLPEDAARQVLAALRAEAGDVTAVLPAEGVSALKRVTEQESVESIEIRRRRKSSEASATPPK